MGKIKLALIDDNPDFCAAMEQSISRHYGGIMSVIGTAHDGAEGIRLLNDMRPDVALIDVYMPVADGVTVVRSIRQSDSTRNIACIMLSSAPTDYGVNIACESGADYICFRPFDIHRLAKCIVDINEYKKRQYILDNPDSIPEDLMLVNTVNGVGKNRRMSLAHIVRPQDFAEAALLQMGFSSGLKGFYFLKTAISCCINDAGCLDMLTKLLYPKVAKLHSSSEQKVERAMRHSILSAWEGGKPEMFYELKGETPERIQRPTVGAFLRSLVDVYISKYKNYENGDGELGN